MSPSRRTAALPVPSALADPARLDALRDVGLVDAAPDATLTRLARITAELLGVPVAIVSLLEADREFIAAVHGPGILWLERRVAPLSHSLCRQVVASEAPLVVADGRSSELASCRRAARDLHLRAYAGVPLTLHDGHTLGALCAIDTIPRAWSEQDVDTLRDVAEITVDVLEARRATRTRVLHDRLTGLPVRSLFGELVTRALARPDARTAVIALGLDGFRLVNDATVGLAVAATKMPVDDMIHAALDSLARTKAGAGADAPDPPRRRRAADRLGLHGAITDAHERGELQLAYQPLFTLRSGRLNSLEALLRWTHPELGPIAPDEFILSAERSGAIVAIGAWVIAQAARDVARWRTLVPGLSVAVNVAPIQLRTPELRAAVHGALTRHDLPVGALTLEITERVFLDDPPAYARALQRLRALGVQIALDDFGTGYSALSYLTRLPLDSIKIDRAFVAALDGDPRSDAVIDGIAAIAARLGLRTVAEGIETAAQRAHVTRLGCDLAQGFHFARPLVAAELEPLLRRAH